MVLATVAEIQKAIAKNECKNFIVYGPLGKGKTSYAVQCLMELNQKEIEKDGLIQTISKYYFHNPLEMLERVRKFDKAVAAIAPDDFAVWMYSLDYGNPLVKAIVKYFQMIRTKTHGVIMTAPTPTLILTKLRCFPQTITIKISEAPGHHRLQANRPLKDIRIAKAYRSWLLPDLQKLRVHKLYEDEYSCMLPNELYQWLEKKRKIYVKMLEEEIERKLPPSLKLQLVNEMA
jgi:hypothetical protein